MDANLSADSPPPPPVPAPRVTTRALFTEFLKVGVSGFGGVLPFARRMLVERRAWLTDKEFNEVLSLSQFLPGPNIANVSIIVGRRFQGPRGAIAAILGLMLMPIAIVLLLAMVFAEFAQVDAVRGACNGVSASASGLVVALALKMGNTIRRTPWQVGVAVVAFAAIGLARQPLLWVLAALVPLAVACGWWRRE
jgi:chromate transporter